MSNTPDAPSPHGRPDKVLLVGDVSQVFLDADAVSRYGCEVETNILDAIDAAGRNGFGTVGVVMNGTSSHLSAALRALRQTTRARIVLLARMYDEPIARRLMGSRPEDEKLADGYLICPTQLERLCGAAETSEPQDTIAAPVPVTIGPDLEKRIRHLEYLATTDDLTGLKNRRYILEFARQVLDCARREQGRVTLLVFDIDNFKHYNDKYGHLTGDEILKQAAILMQRCCRSHDVVGRLGGDEFAAVFWDDPRSAGGVEKDRRSSDAEHPAEAIEVARRFQKEFGHAELPLLGPDGTGVLTISGGLASFPRDGATVSELLGRADAALLEAKRDGKNRIYLVGTPQNNIADLT